MHQGLKCLTIKLLEKIFGSKIYKQLFRFNIKSAIKKLINWTSLKLIKVAMLKVKRDRKATYQ